MTSVPRRTDPCAELLSLFRTCEGILDAWWDDESTPSGFADQEAFLAAATERLTQEGVPGAVARGMAETWAEAKVARQEDSDDGEDDEEADGAATI